jgi:hypothetical protein
VNRTLALITLCTSAAAWAWPYDVVRELDTKTPAIVKLHQVDWFQLNSEDKKLLDVEWVEAANELILNPLKSGRVSVLLSAQQQLGFWNVLISEKRKPAIAALERAKKNCPGIDFTPIDDVKLTVSISAEPCRQAALELLRGDGFVASQLRLTFTPEMLQAQLKDIQAALKPWSVTARYVGAGLVLQGSAKKSEQAKLYWAIFFVTLGRLAVDDQIAFVDDEKKQLGRETTR